MGGRAKPPQQQVAGRDLLVIHFYMLKQFYNFKGTWTEKQMTCLVDRYWSQPSDLGKYPTLGLLSIWLRLPVAEIADDSEHFSESHTCMEQEGHWHREARALKDRQWLWHAPQLADNKVPNTSCLSCSLINVHSFTQITHLPCAFVPPFPRFRKLIQIPSQHSPPHTQAPHSFANTVVRKNQAEWLKTTLPAKWPLMPNDLTG